MNDFKYKALVNSIRSEGTDIQGIVSCSISFSIKTMYLSKIKINDDFLYVRSHSSETEAIDIKLTIVSDIKNNLSKFDETNNSIIALVKFIQDQLVNKLNFDKRTSYSYSYDSLRDYAIELSHGYHNGAEFIAGIEEIDFDKFYEKCVNK